MADEIKPAPVTVENKDPLDVKIVGPEVITPAEVKMPSKTTDEQDRTTASQREVSLMWETTQMRIAMRVITVSLGVAAIIAVAGRSLGSGELQLASAVFLYGVANLVTGFYFGRTNHTRVGGVGAREDTTR